MEKDGKWEVIFRKRVGHKGRKQGPARGKRQMTNSKWAQGDTIEKMLRRRKKRGRPSQQVGEKVKEGIRIVSHNKGWNMNRVKMARCGGVPGERETRGVNDTGSEK